MDLQDKQYDKNEQEQNSKKIIKKRYSKKELEELKARILEDVADFRAYKQNACYYDPETKDINTRLKKDDERYLMYTAIDDSGWSNTRSTALFKSCRAVAAERADLNSIVRIKPRTKADFNRKPVFEKLLESLQSDPQYKQVDLRTLDEMVRYGWAIKYVPWKKIVRPVKVVKKAREMSEEEIEAVKKDKIIPYTWKNLIEYNDIDTENINPEDFYPERDAYRIHSRKKPMNKCAIIEYISYDDFKRETDFNPTTIKSQQKKVKKGGYTGEAEEGYGKTDDNNSNLVERIRYFNKINDEMVVLYNGEPVNITVLPFHEIPLVDYHFITFKDKFFTPGLGALLDALMGDEEDIKNMFKDELKININPPTYVDQMVFNEFLQIGDRVLPGEIIPITGLGANPNMIREAMPKNIRTADVINALNDIETDVIEVVGVNPRRFGSLQRSSNATEVATVDAASAKILRLMLNNLYEGELQTAKLMFNWIQQEYTKKIVIDRFGERLDKPITRKLVLDGVELIYPQTDEEKIRVKKIEGLSEFDLTEDRIKFEETPIFFIDPESDAKLNRAANSQKWQNIFPQMVRFAGDPMYTPPGQPVPPFNINKVSEYYAKNNDIPEDVLNATIEDPIEDRNEALEENEQILKGDIVIGQMGRSRYHIEAHLQGILLVERYIAELRKNVQENINPMLQKAAQQMGITLPTELPEERALRDMEYRLEYLRWHTEVDRMPRGGILLPQPDSLSGKPPMEAAPMPMGASMGTPPLPGGMPSDAGAMPGMMPVGNNLQ